jgi:hypothetical protein
MDDFRLKRQLVLALASFAVFHAWIFWHLRDSMFQGYGDFASFYTAGKIVQQGQSWRLYDRGRQWRVQQAFASSVKTRTGPLPYIRPPFEALLFLPLSYLPYRLAFMVWTGIKILMLFAASFLLRREIGADSALLTRPMLLGGLCLGFFPVAFDLVLGQDSILLLLVLTLVFISLEKGSDFRAGAWLGAGLFKFHLVIPLFLVLLLKRRSRAALGFSFAATTLFLLSIMLVGWSGLAGYPAYLWGFKQVPSLAGMETQGMPNIRGLLTPLLGSGRVPLLVQVALLALPVLGIVVTARTWRASTDSRLDRMGFSFCVVVTLVTSYYANTYDLTLLILPLLLAYGILFSDPTLRGWARTLFMASAGLLLCSPLCWVLALRFDQFRWMALVLLTLSISLAGLAKALRLHPAET